jgi:hypothetical protein
MIMKINRHYLKLILSVIFINYLMISASAQQQKQTSRAQLGTAFKGSFLPVKSLTSQGGDCSAVAPIGWMISGASPQGNALDLIRTDKSMYAGYLNVGIQGEKAYNDKAFESPKAFIQTTLSDGGKFKVKLGSPLQDKLGMTVLPFELKDPNDPRQGMGIVIYQVTNVPGDINGYIIEMYTAQTFNDLWESRGAEALAVALSIRCIAYKRTWGGASTYRRVDANKIETFYDGGLGLEYAHESGNGDLFWVNPSTDRNDQGTQGPGYYLKSGNDLKKLLTGRNN